MKNCKLLSLLFLTTSVLLSQNPEAVKSTENLAKTKKEIEKINLEIFKKQIEIIKKLSARIANYEKKERLAALLKQQSKDLDAYAKELKQKRYIRNQQRRKLFRQRQLQMWSRVKKQIEIDAIRMQKELHELEMKGQRKEKELKRSQNQALNQSRKEVFREYEKLEKKHEDFVKELSIKHKKYLDQKKAEEKFEKVLNQRKAEIRQKEKLFAIQHNSSVGKHKKRQALDEENFKKRLERDKAKSKHKQEADKNILAIQTKKVNTQEKIDHMSNQNIDENENNNSSYKSNSIYVKQNYKKFDLNMYIPSKQETDNYKYSKMLAEFHGEDLIPIDKGIERFFSNQNDTTQNVSRNSQSSSSAEDKDNAGKIGKFWGYRERAKNSLGTLNQESKEYELLLEKYFQYDEALRKAAGRKIPSYDKNHPSYHEYIVSYSLGEGNVDKVFKTLLEKKANFIPNDKIQMPFYPFCDGRMENLSYSSAAPLAHLHGKFPVEHVVNHEFKKVTNITLENHMLHPGIVEFRYKQVGKEVCVYVHGNGTGIFPFLNESAANKVWLPTLERQKDYLNSTR